MIRGLFAQPVLWLLACVICAPNPAGGAEARPEEPVQFRLLVGQQEYKRGEPIRVGFELANTGTEPTDVNARFYLADSQLEPRDREVALQVLDPSGAPRSCQYRRPAGYPKTDDFQRLEPGKSVTSEHEVELQWLFSMTAPGIYHVSGTYENVYGPEIGLETVKGPLHSETIAITNLE